MAQIEQRVTGEQVQLEHLKEEIAGRGGSAIEGLEHDMGETKRRLEEAQNTRERLDSFLEPIGRKLPRDATEFEGMLDEADTLLDTFDKRREELDSERYRLRSVIDQHDERVNELHKKLAFYRKKPVNITLRMAEDRSRIAEATGIPEEQLPYAAELMDIADGEKEWRLAANVGFHGIASLLLVDQERLDEFSIRINSLHLNHRVAFEGVRLRAWRGHRSARDRLSSKLVFKEDSPFSAWLADRLSDSAHDYICVDTPHELGGRGQLIPKEGQTRHRTRGAHGFSRHEADIIGFSNEPRIRMLEQELKGVQGERTTAQHSLEDLERHKHDLERRRDAAMQLRSTRWDALDTTSLQERLDEIKAEIEKLRNDPSLAALLVRRDKLEQLIQSLVKELGANEQSYRQLGQRRDAARAAAVKAECEAQRLDQAGVIISEEQRQVIIDYAEQAEAPYRREDGSLTELSAHFDSIVTSVPQRVRASMRTAQQQRQHHSDALEQIFTRYHRQWLDPDDPTGTTVESYPDYLRMLEDLEAEQLDLHVEDWLAETLRQTAASLVPLSRAYSTDRSEMDRRMRPINDIMQGFSFGAHHGQLEIIVSSRTPKQITDFRRELTRWTELATQDDFPEAERKHRELRDFMQRLTEALRQRTSGPLNTKRLVYITVVAHYDNHRDEAFSSLGAKSGGETQELIAFILGAALLYCLGDNGQAKPTFAPVFLDEAFIKADERFTRRAIEALSGLGFQVIIAVPTSKVQAVEPVAQEYVCISKDPTTSHSYIDRMTRVKTKGAVGV
jgi:uncharacterized protein YPO0396